MAKYPKKTRLQGVPEQYNQGIWKGMEKQNRPHPPPKKAKEGECTQKSVPGQPWELEGRSKYKEGRRNEEQIEAFCNKGFRS